MSVLARIQVRAPGAFAAGVVAGRADDDIAVAVAIEVAGRSDMLSELIFWIFGGKTQQHMPVLAGIDIGLAGARRARSDIDDAITVGIARRFHAGAELVARFAVNRPQQFAAAAGIHVDAPGCGTANILGRRGSDEVGRAIAVDVAQFSRDPSELVI